MITYGAVKWGFRLRAGRRAGRVPDAGRRGVGHVHEALERHRDFYVHEPVTFYFGFDKRHARRGRDRPRSTSSCAYLTRNPTVTHVARGLRRHQGRRSDYNLDLSLRRAEAVQAALMARASTRRGSTRSRSAAAPRASATTDAGTGDQGGDAAVGADQDREANRWANRRVVPHVHPTPDDRARP